MKRIHPGSGNYDYQTVVMIVIFANMTVRTYNLVKKYIIYRTLVKKK